MIHSADEFHRLRLSEAPEEQQRATHEEAPLAVWQDVIAKYPELREWVAHNKTVPIGVLEILGRDMNPRVRWAVAQKRKLPEPLQLLLARDLDPSVRARIAYNAKATRRALELLLEDPAAEIRTHAQERLSSGNFAVP